MFNTCILELLCSGACCYRAYTNQITSFTGQTIIQGWHAAESEEPSQEQGIPQHQELLSVDGLHQGFSLTYV